MQVRRIIPVALLLLALTAAVAAPPRRPYTGSRQGCRTMELAARSGRHAPGKASQYVTTGTRHQLVVMAQFSDTPFKGDDFMALWNDIYNASSYTGTGHYGSVHDYFLAQSGGQFDLVFDLYYTTLPHGYAYYGVNDSQDNDKRAGELVVDAVKGVQSQIADWSVYDWNGDGYVNQVIVQYSGMGENDGGADETVWPHQWYLSDEGTGAFTLDCGLKINNYECSAEIDGSGGYGTFGVLCHEFSHCFGLPDYYYGRTSPLDAWDVMDYGLYNGDGFCPAGYSAHERMLMGWMDLTTLTEPATVSQMAALTSGGKAYKVVNDGHTAECYVLENRQPEGWDQCLPGSGVLITHVDYNETSWLYNTPNTSSRKRMTYFHANNNAAPNSPGKWTYPCGENDSLTNTSKPSASLLNANTDETKLMSKPITEIKVTGGVASFKFMGGEPEPSGIKAVYAAGDSRPVGVYDLRGRLLGTRLDGLPAGVYIVRHANGEILKVFVRPL